MREMRGQCLQPAREQEGRTWFIVFRDFSPINADEVTVPHDLLRSRSMHWNDLEHLKWYVRRLVVQMLVSTYPQHQLHWSSTGGHQLLYTVA